MSIEKTTFQQEQNELLEYLVNNLIYPRFNIYEDGHSQSVLLELFSTIRIFRLIQLILLPNTG